MPASTAAVTNAMKTSPWDHSEDLDPDLGARAAQVLEVHPDQQPDPAHGFGQRDQPEPSRGAADVENARHGAIVPDRRPSYYAPSLQC